MVLLLWVEGLGRAVAMVCVGGCMQVWLLLLVVVMMGGVADVVVLYKA